jgi:predicted RNase H-like HicB family nuclease
MMKYAVVYEQAPQNWAAYVPDLPGCVATGRTRAAVQRRIREAIGLHLGAIRDKGERVPEMSATVEVVEV